MREYSANIIPENMLMQVDSKGSTLTMINTIIDCERDDSVAVPKSDSYVVKNTFNVVREIRLKEGPYLFSLPMSLKLGYR